jgi:hypothetical protein
MKKLLIPAATLLSVAAPAHATGGLVCRTAGARPIEAWFVVSHTVVPTIVSARLSDGGRDIPVKVAQSWLEPDEVRIDLTDSNAMRHELRLRAKLKASAYDGSLWRNGVRRWVRCREA